MGDEDQAGCTAFEGTRRVAAGTLAEVVGEVKRVVDRGGPELVLIFDDAMGQQVEVDFRGTVDEVLARLGGCGSATSVDAEVRRGPGRPRLGVVAREVTLLPRHWEWLNGQPGGASVALRKLVDQARRDNEGRDALRRAQETTHRVMSALAGNLPGFEEALRALYALDAAGFAARIGAWPADVRDYVMRLAPEPLRS